MSSSYEYVFANEAYAQILGLNADEIVGRKVPDLLGAGWAQIRPRLDRALAGERVIYELELAAALGTTGPRWFRVMYEPRAGDAGPTVVVVVVVVDVTEQRRTEASIRESEARFRSVFENAAT